MPEKKKGANTTLMIGGSSVPVKEGVAAPPPEKKSFKEINENIEEIENRLDCIEEQVESDPAKVREAKKMSERMGALEKTIKELSEKFDKLESELEPA